MIKKAVERVLWICMGDEEVRIRARCRHSIVESARMLPSSHRLLEWSKTLFQFHDPLAPNVSFAVPFVRTHVIDVEGHSLSTTHLKFLEWSSLHEGRHPMSSADLFPETTPIIQPKAQVRAGKEPRPHARIPAMVFHRNVDPWTNAWPNRRFRS